MTGMFNYGHGNVGCSRPTRAQGHMALASGAARADCTSPQELPRSCWADGWSSPGTCQVHRMSRSRPPPSTPHQRHICGRIPS